MKRYMILLISLLLCGSTQAQDKFWLHNQDPFGEHKTVDLTPFDSLVFTKSNMRLYRKESKKYSPVAYQPDIYDYYTFENPFPMIHKPNDLKSMDFDDESSQWCWKRSAQSKHFVIFWEEGFGDDPKNGPGRLRFDPDALLEMAEYFFTMYTDSLGFAPLSESETVNKYKLEIYVNDESAWLATGSGYDDKIGALWCNVSAVTGKTTLAHEIGHSFQYIVACDLGQTHGWRYGFGTNASGGCAWWESCANWQAYKCYPQSHFTEYYNPRYHHLNLLHETWRYYNIFIQDYWCMLHGEDFIGRLWRQSVKPEDPVEAYQRLTGIDQATFNDEIYDFAARSASWDIGYLRELGARYMNQTTNMTLQAGGKTWRVDSTSCPQNYGHNIVKLNSVAGGTTIAAHFKGIAGAEGFRSVNLDKAGWRYGFVALGNDGTRTYGETQRSDEGTVTFTVPEGTKTLWFVVSGAPTEHWRHAWDDNDANDEQWPYEVSFSGTNRYGYYNFDDDYERSDTTIYASVDINISDNAFSAVADRNTEAICTAFGIGTDKLREVTYEAGSELCTFAVGADGTVQDGSNSYLYYFDKDGNLMTNADPNSTYAICAAYLNSYEGFYVIANTAGEVKAGETYTIKMGIRYTPSDEDGKSYRATYVITVNLK